MEQELNNIIIEIPVIAKRGRGRPAKPKAQIDDAIPVVRKPRGCKPKPEGPVLNPAYFLQY